MATATSEEKFKDRSDAALRLAEELSHLRGEDPLILAIPRGAVAMAKLLATELEGDFDILLVHKIGHPKQPEYAIGSVNEKGHVFITDHESSSFIGEEALNSLSANEVNKLQRKRNLYTPYRGPIDVKSRTCVIVDDGIATGSTFQAAINTLKEQGAGRIIVAAPVASRQAMELLRKEGVELCVLKVPTHFFSVSSHFEQFEQVDDSDVVALLNSEQQEVEINCDNVTLRACLQIPKRARALIVFAHGSGSGRLSPRNQYVAHELFNQGYATLLADLLTQDESKTRDNVFDIDFLAQRLSGVIEWGHSHNALSLLPIILFGASTGAAAAIKAAVKSDLEITAIVSRGGRVDLADEALDDISAPMLFVVGALDASVLDLNREAIRQIKHTEVELVVVDNASHLFEEPGALEKVSELVISWLDKFFSGDVPSDRSSVSNLSAL